MTHDVLIIGAGPVGLSLATALARQDLKVAVVEKSAKEKIAKPAYDGREIALTHTTQAAMDDLGQWQYIPGKNIHAIGKAHVLDGYSPYRLHFKPGRRVQDRLGFMISNHYIRQAAYEAARSYKNIDFIWGQAVQDLTLGAHHAEAKLENGKTLHAKLIAAADTRLSSMRRLAGIQCDMLDFGRTCIVSKAKISGSHDNIATEWFQYGHTLALLPLGEKELSVVITIESDKSSDVLSMSPEDFSTWLTDQTGYQAGENLGDIELISERHAYPLVATYANKFYAQRFALVGDAAVGMHPVTAHGFNLGLQSITILADEINKADRLGQDIGSTSILAAYNRRHRRGSRLIYEGTNQLVRLYTSTSPLAKIARKALLRLGNHVKPAQNMIINQLTHTSDIAA